MQFSIRICSSDLAFIFIATFVIVQCLYFCPYFVIQSIQFDRLIFKKCACMSDIVQLSARNLSDGS